jgi:hypothetical protein
MIVDECRTVVVDGAVMTCGGGKLAGYDAPGEVTEQTGN